jgi:hypothetical protein
MGSVLRRSRWPAAVTAALALALLSGCGGGRNGGGTRGGGTEPLPPLTRTGTPSAQTPASSQAQPATLKPMSLVIFPGKPDFSTFATRGVASCTATPSKDRTAVTCTFTATKGDETHYGGVAIPVTGSKAFRLTVRFLEGSAAVKAIFVTAVGKSGGEAGRWGYDVDKLKGLVDGGTYAWEFRPGQGVGGRFWAIPGKDPERRNVHFFVDARPGATVSFVIARAEEED